tara:strand:- start:5341 stop:6339 length:999 start_codon:yes stop_codon:yes gene_type:complete
MRKSLVKNFLKKTDWAHAVQSPLPGDASFRRYIRLIQNGGGRAMLMDAPPPQEDVQPFIRIAELLLKLGLSAPRIIAYDAKAGFLLLEDFGDDTYTRLLKDGADELELYQLATDTLIKLHRSYTPLDDIPPYDDKRLLDEVALLVDWYLPAIRGSETPANTRNDYLQLWQEALKAARDVPDSLILRDYHVDNLMRLSGRTGIAACGLLDFQDAVNGPVTYDLVSLFEDARRDVSPELAKMLTAHYLDAFPTIDREAFFRSYAVLGAQRSAKIIGIFTRLDRRDDKAVYLEHIPRVFNWLANNLVHPALQELEVWFALEIPPKDRAIPESTKG